MRKSRHRKLRSCALCKPHKRGHANRWKPREFALLRESETQIRSIKLPQPLSPISLKS